MPVCVYTLWVRLADGFSGKKLDFKCYTSSSGLKTKWKR